MDTQSHELAVVLSKAQGEILDPAYQELRAKLYGQLAVASLHYENLQEQTRQRQENLRLLRKFVALLPRAQSFHRGGEWPRFMVSTPYEARAIAANVIWHNDELYDYGDIEAGIDNHPSKFKPYYIIGQRTGSRFVEFLGASAEEVTENRDSGLRVFRVKRRRAETFVETQQRKLVSEPSQEWVDALYDHRRGMLDITANSPHSAYTSSPFLPMTAAIAAYGKKDRLRIHGMMPFEGLLSKQPSNQAEQYGPTDEDLARFNILEHLGRTAIIFGVRQQYEQLLSETSQPALPEQIE